MWASPILPVTVYFFLPESKCLAVAMAATCPRLEFFRDASCEVPSGKGFRVDLFIYFLYFRLVLFLKDVIFFNNFERLIFYDFLNMLKIKFHRHSFYTIHRIFIEWIFLILHIYFHKTNPVFAETQYKVHFISRKANTTERQTLRL